jgi:hypothetical protein
MYNVQSVDCGLILLFLSVNQLITFSAATWAPTKNVMSWKMMLVALLKVFVPTNVTPALRMLDRCDGWYEKLMVAPKIL